MRSSDAVAAAERSRRVWLPALAFAALTFLLRAGFLALPFAAQDEGYYAATARATAAGSRLYADLAYVRPPALNVAYEVAWRIAGALGTPFDLTLRALASLVAAAAVGVLAAFLFRRLRPLPATLGSVLAALFSASLALQNEANSETWMMLPYVASAVLAICAAERMPSGRPWRMRMLTAGALTGAAALFKEVALVNLAVPLLAVLLFADGRSDSAATGDASAGAHRSLPGRLGRAGLATAIFAAGALGALGGAVGLLALSGQAVDYLYSTWYTRLFFHIQRTRATASASDLFLRRLPLVRDVMVIPLAITVVAAAVAMLARVRERSAERRLVLFGLAWLAVSTIGVAASGRFYPHYFIQASGAVALLAAAAIAAADRSDARGPLGWALAAVLVAACAFPAFTWIADLRTVPDVDASREVWRALAERADAATPTGGTLLVWGDRVSVRAYSDVTPATDVVWSYYVFGEPGGVEAFGRRFPSVGDVFLADLQARTPDTIVATAQLGDYLPGVRVSTLDPPDDLRVEEWLLDAIDREFEILEADEQYMVFVRRR